MSPVDVDDPYWSVQQNQVIRSNAQMFGWGYFDGYNIYGGFTNAVQHGLLVPGDVHPTPAGYNFVADVLFNWLGLADTAHTGFWNASPANTLASKSTSSADTKLAAPNTAARAEPTAPLWLKGLGSPEGLIAAPVGSLYTRTDGSPGRTLYVKERGTNTTGWSAK
jgi:hypothetical protein